MPLVCEKYIISFRIMWDGLRPTPALSAYMELMDRSESKGCQDVGLPQTPPLCWASPCKYGRQGSGACGCRLRQVLNGAEWLFTDFHE